MNVTIFPTPLSGTISAIASKSDAHRCLIAAALSDVPTTLYLDTTSDDICATKSVLTALGASFSCEKDRIYVTPIKLSSKKPVCDCRESGSTLRFLLPVAASLYDEVLFSGQGRLPQRPMDALVCCMKQNGVSFHQETLPFTTRGCLRPGCYALPGNISSQYISGLLFALPLLEGDSEIRLLTKPQSVGYIDMTLKTLSLFSIHIIRTQTGFFIPGKQQYRSPGEIRIEGDWSNAAFFLSAGALHGPVCVTGLSQSSLQKDKAILPLLQQFGAQISISENCVTVRSAPLCGIHTDVSEIPDLVPILAAVAVHAKGKSVFSNAFRLRLKESDRIKSTCAMVCALGAFAEETEDTLIIHGKQPLSGGTVSSFLDHRIAMASAIAACACTCATTITQAQAVQKSYPHFYQDFITLGGEHSVLYLREND